MWKVVKQGLVVTLAMCMLVSSKPTTAEAISTTVSRSDSDTDSTYKTSGKLNVMSTITLDVPLNPFAEDSAKSSGTSNTSYTKNGKSVTREFVSHSMNVKISGIGGGTITCPSGVQISYSGSSATYTVSTYNWTYSVYADILAIYGYRESHSVDYTLKKTGKTATTITMNAIIKA